MSTQRRDNCVGQAVGRRRRHSGAVGEVPQNVGNPEESESKSSATHTSSSSSAPSESDHDRSTNVAQAPSPNPASSIANPYPLMQLTSPSSMQFSWRGRLNAIWDDVWSYKAKYELHGPLYTPTSSAYASSGYGSDNEFTKAHAPQSNPDPDPNPKLSTDSGLDSSTDPDLDWNNWLNSEDPPPPRPVSLNELGQAHEYYQVGHSTLTNLLGSQEEPEYEVVRGPPASPSPELANPDSEFHLDYQSLSAADSQPVIDLQAAIYTAKGKAKESRRISGTARDVGNVAQTVSQPSERTLDSWE
jgi:hypothetical protein